MGFDEMEGKVGLLDLAGSGRIWLVIGGEGYKAR